MHGGLKDHLLDTLSPLKAGIIGTISPLIAVAASLTLEQRAVVTFWMQNAGIGTSMLVGLATWYYQRAKNARDERFATAHADRAEMIDVGDDTTKPRLLLLEDLDSARKGMKMILEREGYRVYPSKTVSQALALLKTSIEFHAALIDIHLPDGSGLTVVDQLRAHPDVNVVVMTGDSEEAVIAARQRGVEVFTKPMNDPQALFAALRGKKTMVGIAGQMKQGLDELDKG